MSRRKKKSLFAGCETKEQFIAALEQSIASGTMSVAEQKTAALLAKMKGWDSPVPPASPVNDSRPQIHPTGVNLSEIRRQLAEGLRPNDTALDWILNSPDELFCERVGRFTGISPLAHEENTAQSSRVLHEAVDFVGTVRSTVGGRIVTIAEVRVAAAKEPKYKWRKPKAALEYAVSWQTPDGFCWSENIDADGYGTAPHADSVSEQVN